MSRRCFEYRTSAAGILGVHLTPHDGFPADDHAELELPAQPTLSVIVYSAQPELLRPVLSATPRVSAVYRKPEEYRANDTGLVILDRFIPPQRPTADSIWIDPPALGSPIPVGKRVEQAQFSHWDAGHPGAAGLHTKDFKLDHATVFEAGAADGRIGEVDAGPVIVARPGKPKIVVIGFHPALTGMRYELATPLLFANLLRWISPEVFRRSEISGGSVGSVKLVMDQAAAAPDVKVTAEDGSPVPFTMRDRTLNFFAGSPGGVKVVAGDREYLYSLTLPELWETKWTPPSDAHSGIPKFAVILESSSDLWPWLALAGALGLLAEWLLYGRFRRGMARVLPLRAQEAAGGLGAMSFDHPWVLLALLLPLAWAAWEWRETGRRLALVLKAGTFALIILALASPRIMVFESKVAVVVLADTSASVSAEDLARVSSIASDVERGRGRHWTRVMPFARGTRTASLEEKTKDGWSLRHTAGAAGRGTDLETAIRDGSASLPAGMVPRLLLISDGNENLGRVARAIWQAQQMGIPIDTVALAGRPKPGLRLEGVSIPGQVFSGERFPIDVSVEAPAAQRTPRSNSPPRARPSAHSQMELAAGVNHLRLQANVNAVGAIALAGKIAAGISARPASKIP